MKTMRKPLAPKTRHVLTVIAACASAGLISLSAATSLAAYLDLTTYNYSANYETVGVGATYFGGGTGTSADPYLISTADHLRNLQKLNSLSMFNSATVFNMTSDITWSGDALLPIGSDDTPFEGTFNGKGKTITGLVVNGYNTWDVGMFGYVSITGTIKNFILDKPTINVGANSDGGNADSTNPLHSLLKTAGQQLPVPSTTSGTNVITWVNGTNSATLSGFPSTVTDTAGDTHTIVWESSDSALLSLDSGVWTTHATTGSDATDIYPVMLTASVYAEIGGKVCSYTLERYEITVLGSGKITDATTSVSGTTIELINGVFKTIWPLDTSSGTTTYHGTYVGFFCGHLDGYAIYLGLVGGNTYGTSTNAKIVVSGRVAKTSSSLIGRSRGDDVRDGTGSNRYGHTFDFSKNITTYSYDACAKPYASTPTYYYMYDGTSGANRAGNIAKQISYSSTLSKKYLRNQDGSEVTIDNETYKYMRIYPTAKQKRNLSYKYTNGDGTEETVNNAIAINFSEPLTGAVDTVYRDWYYDFANIPDRNAPIGTKDQNDIIKSDDYNHRLYFADTGILSSTQTYKYRYNFNLPAGYCVNNGFWVYTKGDSVDIINTVTGKNTFRLNFTINYVATTTNSNKEANSWQILYNANNQDIHKYQPLSDNGSWWSDPTEFYGLYYKDAAMQNVLWYDLHHPITYVNSGYFGGDYEEIASKYTPVTIKADGYLHTANVTIEVDRTGDSFWSAYYANYFGSDTWYPCFAIGPGKTDSLTHWCATGLNDANQITNNDGTDDAGNQYYSVWGGPFRIFNSQYDPDSAKSQRGINNQTSQFYNSYFDMDGDLDLNVISFSSIFTNANGNVASTMNNVDYLYDASSCTFDTTTDTTSATYDSYSTWNRASDTKISFDVTTGLATGNATYYYYRDLTSDGFGATVHADYTNDAYVPANGTGYTAATFTKR